MKTLILSALFISLATPAHARVKNVVFCADEYTSVQIDSSGEFGRNEYKVLIKDLRNGDEFPYTAELSKKGSFVSKEAGNPTINTSPTGIAFVKAGWGLVVIEGENCEINL